MKLYDKVCIKKTGIVGTIVDISRVGADTVFTVESDVPGLEDGYGNKWKLFDCREEELETV